MTHWTLAIDTSHHVAVGLARDGVALDATVVADTRAHGEALMPSVVDLLARHGLTPRDIGDVVVGMGPGPFTGLRVGIVTAATLAHLAGLPLRRVCSLDAIAAQWADAPADFVVVSDARRKELYWARYVDGVRRGEPVVTAPGDLPALPLAGVVPEAFADRVHLAVGAPAALDPAALAAGWTSLPEAPAEPYYLRPADATVGGPPKSAIPTTHRRLRASR